MYPRSHKPGQRAARPVLEGLEARALLSHSGTPTADISAVHAHARRTPPVIAQLPKASLQTASTVPATGDVNPYGIAFVPSTFPSNGAIKPGDLLVSNFNNKANLQGTGTTIMRISGGQSSVFFQAPAGVQGLSTALGVLQDGYVLIGTVPSKDGTSATAQQGSLLVLDKNGKLVTTLTDASLLNGPWDLTVNDMGNTAQIFVSNVLSGNVSRFNVTLNPTATGAAQFTVNSSTQVASGYTHHGDPTAFEIGPTGLAYNASTHTLYVASTGDNAIYAVTNADMVSNQSGTGTIVYTDKTHLHGPLGLTFAPDGNLVAAQGDAVNAKKRFSSELVEFSPTGRRGKFIAQFSISPKNPGGAFGVAAVSGTQPQFAAVNDINNTVEIWQVRA
jgi:sugar lactone lactonase YvrE